MTTKIKLFDLLGVRVRKVRTGSELIFINELNKYAKRLLDAELDLSDIHVDKQLIMGEHFSYVTSKGLVFSKPVDLDELVDYSRSIRFYFDTIIDEIAFVECDLANQKVVYSFNQDVKVNNILHRDNRSQGYVSLYALLVVKAYQQGNGLPKLIIDHENYNNQELEYVDLNILQDYGNKLLKDKIEIKSSSYWGYQPEWEAFVLYHRQLGLMNGDYSTVEKYNYMNKNFEVGDAVLYYTTTKVAKGKQMNKLEACYPAVIRNINSHGVLLEYFPIVQTKLTRSMELIRVDEEFQEDERQSIYTDEDFERFYGCRENFSYTELGVGTCTFLERSFIIKPIETDGTTQYFHNGSGIDAVELGTPDTIYAVLEDQGVKFNKEKFKEEFFTSKGKEPVYEQYTSKRLANM